MRRHTTSDMIGVDHFLKSHLSGNPVEDEGYFTSLIAYIHNNPLHHGFVKGIDQWPHSSWFSYLSDKPTKIAREEGLAWFGGREEFVKFHHEASNLDPPGFQNLEGLGAL